MRKVIILVFILALTITGVVLAADSVTLEGYIFDVVGHTVNGTQSTWTYAVTATSDVPGTGGGLSHFSFEFGTCTDHFVSPLPGSYTSPTNITECTDGTYDCQESTYEVEFGDDPPTGLNGIKFGDADPQLAADNLVTHIFQITVDNYFSEGDVDVAVKTGTATTVGTISGPVCQEPLAVNMSALDVGTGRTAMWALSLFLGMVLLTGAVLVAKRNATN